MDAFFAVLCCFLGIAVGSSTILILGSLVIAKLSRCGPETGRPLEVSVVCVENNT